MSGARTVRWSAAVVALLVPAALLGPAALLPAPALASHGAGPSAGAVAHGRHLVAEREHEIAVQSAAIGRARQRLNALRTNAEVAFEAYDGARVKLASASAAVQTAHQVLASANRQLARGQAKADRFATSAYEGGGLSSDDSYLGPGGPGELVARIGAVAAIAGSQQQTIEQLDAARIYQSVVSRQAEGVQATAAAAARVAHQAKTKAEVAVHAQAVQVASLHQQQARLRTLLVQARAHASVLVRARLAAIARQRAAQARAAATRAAAEATAAGPSPYAGASGTTAGTVSASEGAAAVAAAESQIGKPYQWAAAGPNTYDCSGLTLWAYATVGVSLDHWTHDQWNEGAHVSQAELRPGDLVFFALNTSDPSTIHHVGMYVGNGEMVDAPFTGANVRYDSMLRPDYIGAVRPFQQ